MERKDIRWHQRLANYSKALKKLIDAVELAKKRKLSELERQGLIQVFEFTHELAWKTIKDFYEDQGETGVQGSRDVSRIAFSRGLIEDGEIWMDMIKSRNQSSHTYNEETADEIISAIIENYADEFLSLQKQLNKILEK